jgi:hypothetical protein
MRRQLCRLLRLRETLEDISHLNFLAKSAEMRELELVAARQRELALSVRADALFMLSGEKPEREAWRMKRAEAEICSWKEAKLGSLARARKPSVNRAREDLLVRRLDRLQTEILHDDAVRAERTVQDRREQNRIDDWFQGGPGRRNRQQK